MKTAMVRLFVRVVPVMLAVVAAACGGGAHISGSEGQQRRYCLRCNRSRAFGGSGPGG